MAAEGERQGVAWRPKTEPAAAAGKSGRHASPSERGGRRDTRRTRHHRIPCAAGVHAPQAQAATYGLPTESAAHTLDHDEVFFVLSGSIRLTPEGEILGPRDVAVVPAGQSIELANPGDVPAEVYVAIHAGFIATTADGQTLQPPWAQ